MTKKQSRYNCIYTKMTPENTDGYIVRNNKNYIKLSDIQKEALKHKCPACDVGNLHEVEGETEIYLWCNKCDLSMDSDGGYTN